MEQPSFKNGIIWYWKVCHLKDIEEYGCCKAPMNVFLLLEAIYYLYAENVAVEAQRTISNDTIIRIFKKLSLESNPRIHLLGASKACTLWANLVSHGCLGDYCWEASVHIHGCGKRYPTSTYYTTLSQEMVFVHDHTTSLFCSRYEWSMSQKCCLI